MPLSKSILDRIFAVFTKHNEDLDSNANAVLTAGRTPTGKGKIYFIDEDGHLQVGILGNTAADGSGDTYFIKTDSSGRLHTRGFRLANGNAARMLVDNARHGQVDIISSALPAGAAKESKQLADNHNVTVSNPTADTETGLAKEAKQDDVITELQKLVGFEIDAHDYISRSWHAGSFTETWTFKTGGSGGTTVGTLTIVYDDVNKSNIVTVTKT